MTQGSALWFGPDEERTFGWLHVPDSGEATAAVLLCPPLGYEYICAYPTFRVLAEQLADAGLVALRFDYHGTGDATGSNHDPDRVGAYVRTVERARHELSQFTDAPVSAVAMRAGALFLYAAAVREPFDRMVLWDPSTSGRAFIKEMQLLRMIGMGIPDEPRTDGSFESAGVDYTLETVEALKALDITKLDGRVANEVLVAARPSREPSTKVLTALEKATDSVDRIPAVGQEKLIDVVSAHSVIPVETVHDIVGWLASHAGSGESHAVRRPPDSRKRAVVAHAEDGEPIVEEARFVGDFGLFVMTTTAESGGHGPWIVGLNNSKDHHIGPNRMWVELAREIAAQGGRFARVDLSAIGDSGHRHDQDPRNTYAPQHFHDVTLVASTLQPDDPHGVVLTGLCSGAYLSVDVAAVFGVRAIYAVNPELDFIPSDLLGHDTETRAAPAARKWTRLISGSTLASRLGSKIPAVAWTVIDKLGIRASPARGLYRAIEQGVETVLVYGDDAVLDKMVRRAKSDLRVLEQSSLFRMSVIPQMDHALMRTKERADLHAFLVREIVARHVAPAAAH